MKKKQFLREKIRKYGFREKEIYVYKAPKGLNKKIVNEISSQKKEPCWMREIRLRALKYFQKKSLPNWGVDLSKINFDDIYYYLKPTEKKSTSWKEVPLEIRRTYEKIGIPEAERKLLLGGTNLQYESEVIYESIQKKLSKKGVIFLDMDSALQKYPEIIKEYFGKLVPLSDNKFAALNFAVWSGGSFVYVPPNVKVELPLQAYFRINAAKIGQFERTLIIADKGSFVHYIEGCTAPFYTTNSLHSAVVEIFVKKGARVRYTTVQNWSTNVYNLVTKRMLVEEEGVGEWIDCNLGSKKTMKYPCCILKGKKAHGEVLSIALASRNQHQDTGGKIIHLAPETTSRIVSKSISKNGGRTSYRGLIYISKGAKKAKSKVVCDALILDKNSRSDTYPTIKAYEKSVQIEHEATVSKIGESQLFYLMTRGLKEEEANAMIVNGFVEPLIKELPLEYAVEMNRLIELEMEGSIG